MRKIKNISIFSMIVAIMITMIGCSKTTDSSYSKEEVLEAYINAKLTGDKSSAKIIGISRNEVKEIHKDFKEKLVATLGDLYNISNDVQDIDESWKDSDIDMQREIYRVNSLKLSGKEDSVNTILKRIENEMKDKDVYVSEEFEARDGKFLYFDVSTSGDEIKLKSDDDIWEVLYDYTEYNNYKYIPDEMSGVIKYDMDSNEFELSKLDDLLIDFFVGGLHGNFNQKSSYYEDENDDLFDYVR